MAKIKYTKEQHFLISVLKNSDYSQVVMARKMNVSKGQINKIINEKIKLTVKMQWTIRQFIDKSGINY